MIKPKAYLLRYGELALKGRNRDRFESELLSTLKARIKPLQGRLEKLHKRLLLHCEAEPAEVRQALSTVYGLSSVSPIWRTHHKPDQIVDLAWKLVKEHVDSGKTFAVKVRRSNKQYPIESTDLQRLVAKALTERGLNLPVNLKEPQLCLGITIDFTFAWLYLDTWQGLGGLPVSRASKHLLLLSGGIDSPVAGNLIQKRGGFLEAIYFHTPPFTVDEALRKVEDLCGVLAAYQGEIQLHVVNFTEIMKALRAVCRPSYTVVLSRRLMMQTAERVAGARGCLSLVTGECLGQVASQTIENIGAIEDNLALPVLRPLIGFDKLEIVGRARALGTFPISTRPFEDCCSLFSPKDPLTRARRHLVRLEVEKINPDPMVEEAADQVSSQTIEATI